MNDFYERLERERHDTSYKILRFQPRVDDREYYLELGKKQERERIMKALKRKDFRGNGPVFGLDELTRIVEGK